MPSSGTCCCTIADLLTCLLCRSCTRTCCRFGAAKQGAVRSRAAQARTCAGGGQASAAVPPPLDTPGPPQPGQQQHEHDRTDHVRPAAGAQRHQGQSGRRRAAAQQSHHHRSSHHRLVAAGNTAGLCWRPHLQQVCRLPAPSAQEGPKVAILRRRQAAGGACRAVSLPPQGMVCGVC